MPSPAFLGQIILFRVENARVRYDDLSAWFDELDLDRDYLIAPLRPVDAFRKATGTTPDAKISYDAPWVGAGAQVTLRWQDESTDKDRIVRRVMRTVKVRGKTGPPEVVARAIFYKRARNAPQTGQGGEKLRLTLEREQLTAEEIGKVEQALTDVNSRYEANKVWVDTNALRGIARDYLVERLLAIRIRDGVYFVFRDLEDELRRLATLVGRFGEECLFHPIELVDAERHRALISEALSAVLDGRAVLVQRELNALRAKHRGRIPAVKIAPLITKYEQIMDLAHDYSELVGIEHAEGALENLTETVVAMRRLIQFEEAQGK